MVCPYCKGEMEQGLIQSKHAIVWHKGLARKVFSQVFSKTAVVLSKFSGMRGSAVVAYCCKDCRKVVIDYSDPYADLNNVNE